MRIFTACLGTETHTGAPLPTDLSGFESSHLVRGGDHGETTHMFGAPLVLWRERAEAKGWEVVEGLSAFATPSGLVVRKVYEDLRDEILESLRAAMPVDAVFLSLHGAMVADGYDDCEEDTLRKIREITGPDIPIGAEYDLHCHITRQFLSDLNALVIYKQYPHTDFIARAEELWQIMEGTIEGRIKPKISAFDCRMIGLYHTTREPMSSFVERMTKLEKSDRVLSISLGHGFPWGDVPAEGTRTIVVTDDRQEQGDALAEKLGRELWDIRDEITPRYLDLDATVDAAIGEPGGPVVIADMADNPGGGGPGDSTFILAQLLERGVTNVAVGGIWDPVAASICVGAGVGARFPLRLGGKTGPTSGDPLDLEVEVIGVKRDHTIISLGGSIRYMGDAAWIRTNGIDIIVHEVRCQNTMPNFFESFDLDPAQYKVLVVKSMQHFYTGYAPLASRIIYCAAPGTLTWDMSEIAHQKIARPVWPIDIDPWRSNEERPWD